MGLRMGLSSISRAVMVAPEVSAGVWFGQEVSTPGDSVGKVLIYGRFCQPLVGCRTALEGEQRGGGAQVRWGPPDIKAPC